MPGTATPREHGRVDRRCAEHDRADDRDVPRIEPLRIVDQVVAALPFDQVAAAAAKQNVAGAEREGLAEAVDDQVGQPGDFRRTRSPPEIALPKRCRRTYCRLS